MLTSILATNHQNILAIDGKIPWKLTTDLKHFKAITKGNTIVVGTKTWETMKNLGIQDRNIFILSDTHDTPNWQSTKDGYLIGYVTKQDVLNFANSHDVYICGGSQVYKTFENDVTTVIKTEVLETYELSDKNVTEYELNESEFKLVDGSVHSENGLDFKIQVLEKQF